MGVEEVTVHGFRSSFRTWASKVAGAPREVAEMSLAHKVGSDVEGAYSRSGLMEGRRGLMEHWARHVTGAEGVVVAVDGSGASEEQMPKGLPPGPLLVAAHPSPSEKGMLEVKKGEPKTNLLAPEERDRIVRDAIDDLLWPRQPLSVATILGSSSLPIDFAKANIHETKKEFPEEIRAVECGLPRSSCPVTVLVHDGSWRHGWVGRRSGSGWRSRPLHDLRRRGGDTPGMSAGAWCCNGGASSR